MKTVIATEKLHTLCKDSNTCTCPKITGDKACVLVALVNAFVTETNPIKITMTEKDYTDFLLYLALAELVRG